MAKISFDDRKSLFNRPNLAPNYNDRNASIGLPLAASFMEVREVNRIEQSDCKVIRDVRE